MTLFRSKLPSYIVLNYVPKLTRNNPLVAIPVTLPINLEISVDVTLDDTVINAVDNSVDTDVEIIAPAPSEVKYICKELIVQFINRLSKEVGFAGYIEVTISSEVPQQLRSIYVTATNYLVKVLSGELSDDLIYVMNVIDRLLGIDEATKVLRYSIFCQDKPIIWRGDEGYICSQYEAYADIRSIKYIIYNNKHTDNFNLEDIPKSISNALIHLTGAVGIEVFKSLMKEHLDMTYMRLLLKLINSLNYLVISDDIVNSLFTYLGSSDNVFNIISKDIGGVIDVIKFNIIK